MIRRRPREYRPPARSEVERAAIAVCKSLHRNECHCENAPTVCDAMHSAAIAAVATVNADLAMQMGLEHAAREQQRRARAEYKPPKQTAMRL